MPDARSSQKRLLCVVAHPDDETFGSGSMLIKYAAEGVLTYTSCATRGDVGEIADTSDATPETLSAVREQEYYDAGKVMGVQRSILYGYRDSGMAGTADNEHPNAYINAPIDEVVAKVVDTIRELKPQIVSTFDEGGGYGHPDHIHASKSAKLAYFAAGDPEYKGSKLEPWKPSKLYYHGFPRSIMRKWMAAFAEKDPDSDLAKLDPEMMGIADDRLTTVIDIAEFADTRRKAIAVHRTQYSPLDRMPTKELVESFLAKDYFIRVDPPLGDGEHGIIENDLFDGLDI
ncbi:PIG-L family deacetylase [Dehalococcoides mccartyi]|nr:PIG-L family deacetylase [Dehalococcoides mccartyi]